MSRILILIAIVISSTISFGQINTPKPSPLAQITQEVGLTEISINYSRPSAKGRTVFGDLVPYDKIWRTGANASSKIKFKDDVKIEGKDVPAGEYAIYTIPGKDTWTFILHTNTTYWGVGKDYKESEDQIRVNVKSIKMSDMTETMTFEFGDINTNSCNLILTWEKTRINVKIETEVEKKVMAEIDSKMKGVSQATYYQAAVYYLENGKDLNQALEWINKALENNEKFWMLRQKSLILAKLEKYKDAIATAEKSMKLAKDAENDDYVRMNEKSIADWKTKVK